MMIFETKQAAILFLLLYLVPLLLLWLAVIRFKKKKGLVLVLITIIYISVVYYWTFGKYFFTINISTSTKHFDIVYLYPETIKNIDYVDVEEIKSEPSYKGNYQIIIKTKNGKEFFGAPSRKSDVEKKLKYLTESMAEKTEP